MDGPLTYLKSFRILSFKFQNLNSCQLINQVQTNSTTILLNFVCAVNCDIRWILNKHNILNFRPVSKGSQKWPFFTFTPDKLIRNAQSDVICVPSYFLLFFAVMLRKEWEVSRVVQIFPWQWKKEPTNGSSLFNVRLEELGHKTRSYFCLNSFCKTIIENFFYSRKQTISANLHRETQFFRT